MGLGRCPGCVRAATFGTLAAWSAVAFLYVGWPTPALVVGLAWRGAWAPRERLFPVKLSVALVGTLLASYHSHLHGAVLLAAPLAAVLAHGQPSGIMRQTIVAGLALPTLMLARTYLPLGTLPIPPQFALVLVICFGCLLAEVWLADQGDGQAELPEAGRVARDPALY